MLDTSLSHLADGIATDLSISPDCFQVPDIFSYFKAKARIFEEFKKSVIQAREVSNGS